MEDIQQIKKKKYWLRFGITFLLISSIIIFPVRIYEYIKCAPNYPGFCGFYGTILMLPIGGIVGSLINNSIIISLSAIFFWFIFGAIMGLMYGKIKNRNRNVAQ